MHITQCKRRISFVRRDDVRNAVIIITIDAHRLLQSGDHERSFMDRQTGLSVPETECQQRDSDQQG